MEEVGPRRPTPVSGRTSLLFSLLSSSAKGKPRTERFDDYTVVGRSIRSVRKKNGRLYSLVLFSTVSRTPSVRKNYKKISRDCLPRANINVSTNAD